MGYVPYFSRPFLPSAPTYRRTAHRILAHHPLFPVSVRLTPTGQRRECSERPLEPPVETVEKGFFVGGQYHLSLCFHIVCSCGSRTASPSFWVFSLAVSFLFLLSGVHCSSPPPFHRLSLVEDLLDIMDDTVQHPLNGHFELPSPR